MSKKFNVILIDDDPDDQEIFSYVMEEVCAAVECIFANDGIQGLEKLKAVDFHPDLIFIDINMPRMNGVECLKELKKMKRTSTIPVYMYSTSAESVIVGECLALGATGFLKKEVNMDALQEKIAHIVLPLIDSSAEKGNV